MSKYNCSAMYVVSFLLTLVVVDFFMPSAILTVGAIVMIPLAVAATLACVFVNRQQCKKECLDS